MGLILRRTTTAGGPERAALPEQGTFTVGRHPDNDFIIEHISVHPKACYLVVDEGRVVLFNNYGPWNLWVNGQEAGGRCDLVVGDTLQVGKVVLQLEEEVS